jgi:UPF0755 protein
VKRQLWIGAAAFAIAALALIYSLWWAAGPKRGPHDIIVKDGTTLGSLSRELARKGVVPGTARTYYVMARVFGSKDPIQAGEFEIPEGMGGARVLDLLQHGKPLLRLITVTEGMPSVIVQQKLAASPYLSGPTPQISEGSVLPDSYGFERGEARAALLKRMQLPMTKLLAQLWPKRSTDCPLANVQQAVILASIVEKETGKPAERPMIAGVYCNRLKIGMKLDADPTVIYAVTKGKPLGRRILKSELEAANPYNTYRRPGLPAGPIANPGRASIEAVLHPAATKAMYFVADGTGGHLFAETLKEQNANVARWYAMRRQRGQM